MLDDIQLHKYHGMAKFQWHTHLQSIVYIALFILGLLLSNDITNSLLQTQEPKLFLDNLELLLKHSEPLHSPLFSSTNSDRQLVQLNRLIHGDHCLLQQMNGLEVNLL